MQWMTGDGWTLAYGREHGYLVATGEADVRLSRFSILIADQGLAAKLALGVTRTTVILPLGRGPGRPGGSPELAAMAETAKGYAEAYERGESLEGLFADGSPWRRPSAKPPTSIYRDEPSAVRRFLDQGPAT
jgi:hypothetical protein